MDRCKDDNKVKVDTECLINPPFNYTGSKYKLLHDILPLMDYSKSNFIDVFSGGGSVYTNVLDKYNVILVNDIIKDLINIHKALMESDDIIERTRLLCPDKEDQDGYVELRNSFNNDKSADKLWALMLCCTSNMLRFNKRFQFNQTFGRRTWNDNTMKKALEFVNHIRKYKDKVHYTSGHFELLGIHKNCMYYCDPPYSNTEAGYNAYWNKGDDIKLYNFCKEIDKIGSSFMVSGSLKHNGTNCILLDKLISAGYNVKELEYNYNKVSRVGKKDTKEIVIYNYN